MLKISDCRTTISKLVAEVMNDKYDNRRSLHKCRSRIDVFDQRVSNDV